MNQRGFRIPLRCLTETFGSLNLTTHQFHAFLQWGQQVAFFLLLVVIVIALTIDLDETIELNDFALSDKLLFSTADRDVYGGTFHDGIGHLTGNSALPDQLVELAFLGCSLNGLLVHVCWADGLVSLLGTLRACVILANL